MCGEDGRVVNKPDVQLETPPRVWGRQSELQAIAKGLWKHPHVCGEDQSQGGENRLGKETPPRVWGRLGQGQILNDSVGNTPTCVGKTHGQLFRG